MPARLKVALLVATLLLAAGCSHSAAAQLGKRVSSQEPKQVTIASINVVSSSDGPIVVGLVRNGSNADVGGVMVTAGLTDAKGAAIGQPMFGTTLLHVVPPGASASFSIPFTEAKGTAASVSATVQADPEIPVPYVPLTVGPVTALAPGSFYEVTGTVTNSSASPVTYPNVVGTFYDRAGNVVGAAHSGGTSDTVTPGGTAPFDIILLEEGHSVSRYTLAAEGQVVAPSK
jgi:hypothetical protein